ncbi:MAG TPA: helix-turn-helix domain-containing protein [Candidatus Mediterraneibacter intestinipullorum]|nr:helix-turn-helix domain-containing protein [Candidatus Mediterraneibacter intestinipullorum]
MGIHDRIINLCKERGISQSELERAIGIAKGSVTKWKKQEPRHSSIEKVASYFGVSADYIINGEKSETYYLSGYKAVIPVLINTSSGNWNISVGIQGNILIAAGPGVISGYETVVRLYRFK